MGSKQAGKRGLRYCSDCGFKLRKDGFAQSGKQRWECLHCRASKHIRRPDLSQRYTLTRFVDYLISTDSADKRFDSAVAFRHQSKWCWDVEPRPIITGEIHGYLVIDAKPLKGGTCAVARGQEYVVNWQHGVSENSVLWHATLSVLPEPGAVICDGQRGIYKALDQLWPGIVIQRRHVHIKRNIRTKLTQNPQTDAGADLQWLMGQMGQVSDEVSMAGFIALFDELYSQHGSFLNERTYNANPGGNKKWWYTHGKVRSAYRQIDKLIASDQLFAFITHPELNLPRTTNGLEGGINSRLDELIGRHRGMCLERQRRLVDWYLDSRTERPYLERKST